MRREKASQVYLPFGRWSFVMEPRRLLIPWRNISHYLLNETPPIFLIMAETWLIICRNFSTHDESQ
jgi:hypothetical protein